MSDEIRSPPQAAEVTAADGASSSGKMWRRSADRWLRNAVIVGYLALLASSLTIIVATRRLESSPPELRPTLGSVTTSAWPSPPEMPEMIAIGLCLGVAPAGAVLLAISGFLRLALGRFRFDLRNLLLSLAAIAVAILPVSRAFLWFPFYSWGNDPTLGFGFNIWFPEVKNGPGDTWDMMYTTIPAASVVSTAFLLAALATLPQLSSLAAIALRRLLAKRCPKASSPPV